MAEASEIAVLKNKFQAAVMEKELIRKEATEKIEMLRRTADSLFKLLITAQKERDEAKYQLLEFLNPGLPFALKNQSTATPNPTILHESSIVTLLPESMTNSMLEASNRLYGVESFSENVLPRDAIQVDSSRMGFISQPSFSEYTVSMPTGMTPSSKANTDRYSAAMETLIRRKPLPEVGNLLQTLCDSGPLLDTLLKAESIPKPQFPMPSLQCPGPASPLLPYTSSESARSSQKSMNKSPSSSIPRNLNSATHDLYGSINNNINFQLAEHPPITMVPNPPTLSSLIPANLGDFETADTYSQAIAYADQTVQNTPKPPTTVPHTFSYATSWGTESAYVQAAAESAQMVSNVLNPSASVTSSTQVATSSITSRTARTNLQDASLVPIIAMPNVTILNTSDTVNDTQQPDIASKAAMIQRSLNRNSFAAMSSGIPQKQITPSCSSNNALVPNKSTSSCMRKNIPRY